MENFNINDTALGKSSSTPEKYDASLLFRIPRAENRVRYEIQNDALPFVGVDVWNCYEISFLLNNGLPVSRMMKLMYDCSSEFLVESKSLKLYLNSFNMERCGYSVVAAEEKVLAIIEHDLEQLLEVPVGVAFFTNFSPEAVPFIDMADNDLVALIPEEELLQIDFDHFLETPTLLKGYKSPFMHQYNFRTDLLRSNCRVTNQPDWGDLFVHISSYYEIDLSSVVAYLVSFRKENHFHEEVVEMIFQRFLKFFQPEELMVSAMYTRRGGIDINPLRATSKALIDNSFVAMDRRLAKTLRQ